MRGGRLRQIAGSISLSVAVLVAVAACGGGGDADPTSTPNDVLQVVTPTPGTPVPFTPTPPGEQQIYVVKEGDALSDIAERFGVTQKQLQDANGITDPNSIYVGQEIVIPEP